MFQATTIMFHNGVRDRCVGVVEKVRLSVLA